MGAGEKNPGAGTPGLRWLSVLSSVISPIFERK